MTTAKELRDKLDAEIKALQEVCPHSESQWCIEAWAPAHFTGRQLLSCKCCEKILDTKEEPWETAIQPILVDHNEGVELK